MTEQAALPNLLDADSKNPSTARIRDGIPRLRHQDFLAEGSWQGSRFDLIIGDPPFVRVEHLHRTSPGKVREYRSRYATARAGRGQVGGFAAERPAGHLRAPRRSALRGLAEVRRTRPWFAHSRWIKEPGQAKMLVPLPNRGRIVGKAHDGRGRQVGKAGTTKINVWLPTGVLDKRSRWRCVRIWDQ